MTLQGIDISAHQTTTPSLVGVSFVGCRAVYGAALDAMYDTHAANVLAADKVLLAYAFGVSEAEYDWSAADQAEAFLASVAGSTSLLALDLEAESGLTPMSAVEATTFIAAIHGAGHRIGLYHSDSGFPLLGQDWNWVAKWGTTPPVRTWAFWQSSGSPLDHDVFNGDAAALAAITGGAMFSYLPKTQIGTATVKSDQAHAAFDATPSLTNLKAGQVLPVYGDGTLLKPINVMNATNLDVWIVVLGGKWQYVLKSDVIFAPALSPVSVSVSVAGAHGTVSISGYPPITF